MNTENKKSVKGTQTEKNLMMSFAGESQARMRYTYFASVAKKEGYEQIAQIFLAILPGEPLEILAGMCYGTVGGTIFILVSVFITTTRYLLRRCIAFT